MAKWYYIDGKDGDIDAGAYNMDWFREVTMDVAYFPKKDGSREEKWCLIFEYAVPQGEKDRVETVHADYDIMQALFNKVLDWLQSEDAPAVFHQKQELDACFKEAEAKTQT